MKKKLGFLGMLAIALVFGMMVVGCPEEAPEEEEEEIITIDGWTYYAWAAEPSTIIMTQGAGNDSKKINLTGNVKYMEDGLWGGAGCAIVPNSANLTALKNTNGISFKCKGDGKLYHFFVRTKDTGEYGFKFVASKTEQTINILYDELVQNWGDPVDFIENNIEDIEFKAQTGVTGEGSFNITIWDLKVE
ncbi:MAG: CIA30 family protein [Treponema sp.]|jgi:hypothetical protein|nr:CIA30 family protein [Treponema sp.]